MIANNSTNKLKASKGFRESDSIKLLVSEEKSRVVERGEGDKDRYSGENQSRGSFSSSVVYSRERTVKPRSRHRDDIRPIRGTTERRGGSSRGRGTHRKIDKDGEVFIPRGKFQEPLMKGRSNDGVLTVSSSKYDVEGGKSKSADFGSYISLPEDSRISKILRRMSREDDPKSFIHHCHQLQEAIVTVDNARYIRRALDLICDSLLDMLHCGPGIEAKTLAAKCLGLLGYTLDQDFKRFMEWVFPNYTVERNDEVRGLLLHAVLETVRLEREQPRLKEFASALMNHLHVTLEAVDKANLLTVAAEVIVNLASIYPDLFTKYFKDTVDILVGWHIDLTTPPTVAFYASQSLQRLSPYWAGDIDFSLQLLGNFLEDTENYTDEVTDAESSSPTDDTSGGLSQKERIMKVTAFIKVFNSVMKALGQHLSPSVSPGVSWNFLYDCLARMLAVILRMVSIIDTDRACDLELIISGNECTWYLLELLQNKTCPAHEELYQLIDIEIKLMNDLNNNAKASLLQLIAKVIKELSANLPLELVQQVLKPGSPFLELRLSDCLKVHTGIVAIYQSLLGLKNIPLLKEVYRLIMTDLDCAYRVILPNLEPLCAAIEPSDCNFYDITTYEYIASFHLKALSNIANASGSLIGMWLLQPSILDLLALRLIPQTIGRVSSILLYNELYLLYSHCSRHSHFITTSSLVGGSHGRPGVNSLLTQPSPNSGHFSVILTLLSNILTQDLCEESTHLVLKWCCELLSQSRPYFTTLASTSEMVGLVTALCVIAGESFSASELLSTCASLEQLLIAPYTLYWKKSVLEQIADVCLLHINSSHFAVAARYSALLLRLPWTIVIPLLAQGVAKQESARAKLDLAQHTLITQDTNTGEMSPHYFKQFMAYLLKGVNSGSLEWLEDVFTSCWSLSQCEPHEFNNVRELALSSVTVLLQWATWESAQLCVNSKLRTPLGKPLDTFMAFEGAIKSLARQTVGSSSSEPPEEFDVSRVRLLLELVEQLEKSMYNASDGTATALIPPAKPVRTFFHTNKSTCCEWLSRNRSALVGVALHVGMSTAAVRYGYALLQDLLDLGNTKGSEFENAVLQTGWALLQLKQSDAIHGLYVWCRDIIGVKLPYLKALADQAAGKLETAVEVYTKLINNENVESPTRLMGLVPPSDSHELVGHSIKTLLADQITECYLSLQDWTQLARWKAREAEVMSNQNGGTSSRYKYLTAKDAEAYLEFDREDWTAASELLEWSAELEPKKPTWDCYQSLGTTRQKLANIAIKSVANGIIQDSDREMLQECQSAAHCFLVEGLRNTPSEVMKEAAILEFAANALLSESDVILDFDIDGGISRKQSKVDSTLLSRILWWGQVLERLQITSQPSPQLSLDAARLARKEGNLKLSLRQLSQHINHILHQDNGHRTTLVLTNDILGDMDKCAQPWTLPHAKAFAEVSKLLYSVGQHQLAVEVGAKTCLKLVDSDEVEVKEKCSRILLTVAKWLPSLDPSAVPTITQPLADWHQEIDMAHSLLDVLDFNLEGDSMGVVLQLAVSHCPSLAKAWTSLANWAYRWGRKVTDQVFTPADKEIIDTLIPDDVDKEKVYSVLTHHAPPVDDDDDIEVENLNVSDMIEWQLQSFGSFTQEQLVSLVEMWRKSHARTYNFYQLSAYSYFKYLQLCENPQEDSHAITATLRLLRLIVKHAQELQGVLEVGLANTPTLPWVCIIPQLFSRLSHPQPYVRRRVSELLCRLAADKPHLIIFPSVVGSDAGAATIRDMPHTKLFSTSKREVGEDLDIVEEEDEEIEEDEDESHNGEETQAMENCFQAMVDILAKQDPESITQVQVFVRELRRITLLWDELWLGTLAQHHADMSRRVSYLEQEVVRVDDNVDLSSAEKDRLVAEKHRIILKPLLFVLEQLHAITSVPAETPHEIWFQEKFGANITEVLEKLRSPADPRKPGEAWSALKGLQLKLQQRVTKRSSYSLRMRDISPTLAEMRNTQISMPGMRSVLTIAAIQDHIAVLPTKTKPKKLVFQGSDGKSYTYLFKGLEDLHLDERIMQFLSIANTMLRGTEPGLQARHYAVIPLGLRSGLISWVQGVTPLFSLYKRWQQRQASITQSTVMRPSELFYSKLTPLLKDCDVTKPESRNTWPLAVLKQVLMELMQETPTYLLSRELWCDSVNAGGWWQSTKLYSTSLAVMSIIGYVIGLGDRHLDNVLVDLTTGQVIHIDYNVCFEKGKSLRVPEKVPFRLTPNLRAALGVTGVEGIFRLTCENVLKVMKKGRETVLTLLEAFVYDPLIDWTPGSETGYTGAVYGGGRAVALETKQSRKQLEKEVTVDMLAVRLAEMRYEWLDNRDKLVVELPDLAFTMEKWMDESGKLKRAEEALQERHQQMALVKEAEAHPQHALYSLPVRYAANCAATDASNKARSALQAKLDECARSIQNYKAAMYYFTGPQMAQLVAEVNTRSKHDTYLVFDLIKEFLQNAGQGQMVLQCIQSEKELCELCLQQTQLTRACLDLLEQYAAVVSYFPSSHVNHHRISLYHRWASALLDNFSVESCELILGEAKVCLAPPQLAKAPLVVSYNVALQRLLAEARAAVSKQLERGPPTPAADPPPTDTADPTALQCIVITALCNLNKRFLMLESAANSAMECLVDLTSQKGEWFFDEMCLTVGIMMKLLSLLPTPETDSPLHVAVKCLHAAHNQYKTLQELNLNFTSIILPEAIQKIHVEDPSVLAMVGELDAIIASVQVPLPELVAQLQRHLHFVIMGLESPHSASQELARQLDAAVQGLLQQCEDPLTSGQMLFMGFDGLFGNLSLGSSSLVAALATLSTPVAWKNIDQLRDAKMLSAPVHDSAPRAVLDSIFLVKRLQAMQELFSMCRANIEAFKGLGVTLPCDDDRFHRPIRCFTADYVSCQLLGVFSHTLAITSCHLLQQIGLNVTGEVEQREVGAESRVPLEDLCRVAIDQCLRQGEVTSNTLSQASGAVQGVEGSLRVTLAAARRTQDLTRAEAAVLRAQNQLTAHCWLHEDLLATAQFALPPSTLNRQALMLELRKMCAGLLSTHPRLVEAHEQQNALVASAEQRLKWAAGANPALAEVMCAFETAVNNNNEQLLMEQRLANMVAGLCNSVLHHEAFRTQTSDAVNSDTVFVQLVEGLKQSCLLYQSLNTELTPLEEGLVKLCPPDSQIDWTWIAKAESLISDSVKSLMKQMEPQRIELFAACDAIKSKAITVRSLLGTQYRIMVDVRSLLKTMVKFEEPGVGEYLTRYRAYTERLTTLIKTIVGMDEFTLEKAQNLLQEIAVIQEETPGIYEELLRLGKGKEGEGKNNNKRPPLMRQDSVCMSPKRDPHTGKAVQERNAYAVSVWRRVRWKLEGKDPDPARKYTVQEQVDWAINEATSLDNLALLYEGWTPWV